MLLSALLMMSSLTFANFTEMAQVQPRSATTATNTATATAALDPQDEKLRTPAVEWTIKAVNEVRASAGLSALTFDPACARAARDHAIDTGKNRLRGHTGSDGSQPHERYQKYSSDFSMILENWAFASDPSGDELTPRVMMKLWMSSKDHKANILKPEAKRIGVGFYRIGTNLYAVQCFSAPAK